MPSGSVHNLSLSIEEVILWLSFDPFPRSVDPIDTVSPRYVTILLTNALNNSGKVKMFSTAKLFLIIASIRFAF